MLTDQSSDDDEVPPTQQAEMHQELPLQGGTPDASTESATQAKLRKTKGGEDEIRSMISVPKPKSRGRSRSTPKQLRQTKLTKESDRLAVHKYPSGLTMMDKCPVQLEDAYLQAHIKFIIHPVHLKSNHGASFSFAVEVTRKRLRVHVFLYELSLTTATVKILETVWTGIEKNPNNEKAKEKKAPGLRGAVASSASPGFKLCIDAAYNFLTGYPECSTTMFPAT
ncbi:hypothetical protein GQ600_13895 [Phytophthora cactorum]|nr:hypothetical protein GQ600_13895 [Phytophthora cactorum]